MSELREQIARIIEPPQWQLHDYWAKKLAECPELQKHMEKEVARSLAKADAILALLTPDAARDAVLEEAASVADAEYDYRLRCENRAKAANNRTEQRDFQSMKMAAVQIAAAIRALKGPKP